MLTVIDYLSAASDKSLHDYFQQRLTLKSNSAQRKKTNLKLEEMTWKIVGCNVKYIQCVVDRLQHANTWVWNLKMGTLVRMCLIQLGHAVEQGEMLCNPIRGRFDPVLLENFVCFFVNFFSLD